MIHIHELQFVEKGGVQCSTLGCNIYYSEEHIIKILERLANENASQQGVHADLAVREPNSICRNCGMGVYCEECNKTPNR